MKDFFPTIVLLLPGFMIMHWVEKMGRSRTSALSDFERTIYSLLLNLPIMLLAWGLTMFISIWAKDFRVFSLKSLYDHMESAPFLFGYALFSILLAYFISFTASHVQNNEKWSKRIGIVNFARRRHGLPDVNDGTVWDVFAKPGGAKIVRVYPLGEPNKDIWGVLNDWSNPGSVENAMLLTATKELEAIKDEFIAIKKTYVDFKAGIVIEEYVDSTVP